MFITKLPITKEEASKLSWSTVERVTLLKETEEVFHFKRYPYPRPYRVRKDSTTGKFFKSWEEFLDFRKSL